MSRYEPRISKNADGLFFALVVRIEKNTFGGTEECVVAHYKGRHFKTLAAAEKSTGKYIANC